MPFCKELKEDFATKKEMFAAIKDRREEIIGLKKAAIKFSDPVALMLRDLDAKKAEGNQQIGIGSTIYAVINTTKYYDSHGDVHWDGIWDVSVRDQKGKLYYIINHDLEIGKIIGFPRDVEASVKNVTWAQLGLPYSGTTQALVYAVKLTDKTNKDFLAAVSDKEDLQNSVRMRYIKFTLCINDSDPEYATENDNFWKYVSEIANKEDVLESGYFWLVEQAAIEKEGSAVLFGSNDATPILYSEIDPAKSSQKQEETDPPQGSQLTNKNHLYFI